MPEFNRRSFVATTAAVLAAPSLGRAQALPPVRLLVLRHPAAIGTTNCVATCIRGSIYDVSHVGIDFDPDIWPVPLAASPVCDVIERPWLGNAPNVSAIPAGRYDTFVRNDATKDWMHNENRRWRIQLRGVEGRSAIQFHFGKDEKWSAGCLIVGDLSGAYCRVDNGEAAVARLRSVVQAADVDGDDIAVHVADRGTLFPTLTNGC